MINEFPKHKMLMFRFLREIKKSLKRRFVCALIEGINAN